MAEPKVPGSGHDKLMIGQSAGSIYVAHAILILGLVIVAFPIYYTFVASTQTVQRVLRRPVPLTPGGEFWNNYAEALFGGAGRIGGVGERRAVERRLQCDPAADLVEDRGIGSLAFAAGAKEAGQSEASFRTAVAGMAQGMTPAFLGNTTEALTAAQQLGTFLNGASHLKLTITSKDEAGIGLADLAAAESNPAALAGKLNVVAEASGEPVELPVLDAPAPSTQDEKRDLKAPAAQ